MSWIEWYPIIVLIWVLTLFAAFFFAKARLASASLIFSTFAFFGGLKLIGGHFVDQDMYSVNKSNAYAEALKYGDDLTLNITTSSWLTDLDGRGLSSIIDRRHREKIGGFIPLGSAPNIRTFYCEEDEGFIVYLTDRFGFRNVDAIWDIERHETVFIGDSFAESACVRKMLQHYFTNDNGVVSLGKGGNGPLTSYAVLREYLVKYRPNNIVHLISINDFARAKDDTLKIDLERELQEPELRRYMEDPLYSNNYFNGLDLALLRTFSIDFSKERLKEAVSQKSSHLISMANFLSYGFLKEMIFLRKVSNRDHETNEYNYIKGVELGRVYALMSAAAKNRGANILFVVVPDKKSRCNDDPKHAYIVEVLRSVKVRYLDLWSNLCGSEFFAKRGGHFSKIGYEKMVNLIEQGL